ncbi:hypothetical protein LTR23_009395 [Exophiala sp. CCFEE 6169]|nr:hypothetical protein LTR23_009395 [Chaetothyriales sp. CCFEE 6169]
MKSSGKRTMNAPHDWIVVPYNDIPALQTAVAEHTPDLACIFLELMQGSSGCTPANADFVKACRSLATAAGAVLFFDEVMTSRMSIHGYQHLLGVYPDMTSLGKYFAGGGQNFGAFGGRADIMNMLEPGYSSPCPSGGGGVYHSGTFNNNVTTMATATAVLEQLWTTEDKAKDLFDKGVWLREELNRLAAKHRARMNVTGTGSLMAVHFFTTGANGGGGRDGNAGAEAEVEVEDEALKELFFFDMLGKGFFLARRLMISLMTITSREELRTFVQAVDESLSERAEFVGLDYS